jgi:hypothetical protein
MLPGLAQVTTTLGCTRVDCRVCPQTQQPNAQHQNKKENIAKQEHSGVGFEIEPGWENQNTSQLQIFNQQTKGGVAKLIECSIHGTQHLGKSP